MSDEGEEYPSTPWLRMLESKGVEDEREMLMRWHCDRCKRSESVGGPMPLPALIAWLKYLVARHAGCPEGGEIVRQAQIREGAAAGEIVSPNGPVFEEGGAS